jgi:hypothetical protein
MATANRDNTGCRGVGGHSPLSLLHGLFFPFLTLGMLPWAHQKSLTLVVPTWTPCINQQGIHTTKGPQGQSAGLAYYGQGPSLSWSSYPLGSGCVHTQPPPCHPSHKLCYFRLPGCASIQLPSGTAIKLAPLASTKSPS